MFACSAESQSRSGAAREAVLITRKEGWAVERSGLVYGRFCLLGTGAEKTVQTHLVFLKRCNDPLAFPELDFSILKQPRDRTSRWAKDVQPREVDESPSPGALNQWAECTPTQSAEYINPAL